MFGLTESSAERIFVGLGGNIGDPRRAMASAISTLVRDADIEMIAVSSLYSTPPWGISEQPDFLNAVVELKTTLEPRQLLDKCLEVERSLKRERKERWGPRIIDLDIIAYGRREVRENDLQLPHPRLAERAFVLVPLAEIAPEFVIGGNAVHELLDVVDTEGIERIANADSWLSD
ncbi:MAG: 2-amino-4-hydroxy-6-hydroxymethyldihydropteridine diphosphokinase [Rhizobiaceae bacterium]